MAKHEPALRELFSRLAPAIPADCAAGALEGLQQGDWLYGFQEHTLVALAYLMPVAHTVSVVFLVGGVSSAREFVEAVEAYCFDVLQGLKVKVKASAGDTLVLDALKASGYRTVGTLEREVLRGGAYEDTILLERLHPQWRGEAEIVTPKPVAVPKPKPVRRRKK